MHSLEVEMRYASYQQERLRGDLPLGMQREIHHHDDGVLMMDGRDGCPYPHSRSAPQPPWYNSPGPVLGTAQGVRVP